jgi:di/tricarboxylate transporter
VVLLVLVLLTCTRWAPHVILLGGLTLLLTAGVVNEKDMLTGFANPGMATVAVLFAVVAGLRETGAMHWLAEPLLGQSRSVGTAQARIMGPVAVLSAFMNNTPLVAAMLPVINDWARKHGISISKLLIPLSFASILGGACTLIGTSTILVVNGLVIAELGADKGLEMFDIAKVALPCAVIGLVFLLVCGRRLLPDRIPVISTQDDARQYTVEMLVPSGSSLAGKTIEQAGLRQLPSLYLVEIDRDGQVLPAVSSKIELRDHDRLVFAGVVESVVDLQKIRGLIPATNQVSKLNTPHANRSLVEAVVSDTCPLVGQTIREGQFRTRYNAAVIAVARNGGRINKKIGDIVLRTGDTLLLVARASFVNQQRNSRDFYLVSQVQDSAPLRHEKAPIALLLLGTMVVAVTLTPMGMLNAAMLAAGLMLITGCCTGSAALRSVDWQVLLVIAASLGIGRAMETSGAAAHITTGMLSLAGDNPYLLLAVICAVTMLFTNVINAKAAAVLMFPIAVQTATMLDTSPMPFAIAIMMGAAASFATPIGYQTNLMVFGPGGYHFGDYLKIGLPLSILVWLITVLLIPMFWPF